MAGALHRRAQSLEMRHAATLRCTAGSSEAEPNDGPRSAFPDVLQSALLRLAKNVSAPDAWTGPVLGKEDYVLAPSSSGAHAAASQRRPGRLDPSSRRAKRRRISHEAGAQEEDSLVRFGDAP